MLIKNGIVADYAKEESLDVRIEGDTIVEVASNLEPVEGEKTIDANGCYLFPGAIDLNFHISDVASKKNESFEEAIKGSYKGGITTVLISPDCKPAIDDEFASSFILSKAQLEGFKNVLILGNGIKKGSLNNVERLFRSGVAAVSVDSDISSNLLQRVFQYTKEKKVPLFLSPKNDSLEESGVIHDGEVSALSGLPSLPCFSESSEIAKAVQISKGIDSALFVSYISSKRSVELINNCKDITLSFSVPLANLLLTDEDCSGFNTINKIFPPLRAKEDRDALLEVLKNEVLGTISSNHIARSYTEKDVPFELAKDGLATSAIFLQAIYSKLIKEKKATLQQVLKLISKNPADILNLNKGEISRGYDADIVIFNPNKMTKADGNQFESQDIGNILLYQDDLDGAIERVFVMGEEVI